MKMKYLLAASLASLSAAIVLPQAAQAQQITTGISGTVTDENGNPIQGATVVVTDTRTGTARTLVTGADGNFRAANLVSGGPYTISANASGYEGQTVGDVTTTLQGNTTLTFALSGGAGEIVVTGARVQLAQLAVGPGTSFAGEVLETAPSFNRDIRDIIRIDPRVSLDREDTSTGGDGQDHISCLGGNNRTNAFTVDGISQGDIYGLNGTGYASRSSTPHSLRRGPRSAGAVRALRCRVRPIYGLRDQRHHQVGHQRLSRQCVLRIRRQRHARR